MLSSRQLVFAGLMAAAAMTATSARADDAPPSPLTADELRALEQSLGADANQTAPAAVSDGAAPAAARHGIAPVATPAPQSMNPDLAFVFDGALAYFSDDEPLQLGGHDPRRTGFTFQQLELAIGAAVDPYFRFDGYIVFAQFGVEVEEAYGTTLALPHGLQARGGQFLTRFGRQNPTHPHVWSFADQPLVLGKFFGGEGSRGLGAELSWLAPLPWYVELVASATDAGGACCARSFLGGDELPARGPRDLLYTGALKQFFALSPSLSLLVGLSAQWGPNASGGGNRSEIYGGDLTLKWRPPSSPSRAAVIFQAEAMLRSRQIPHGRLQDHGGYAHLVWQMTPRWEIGGRLEYVSGVVDDPLDPAWARARDRAGVQVTFYPSHFSRLRLQATRDRPRWRDDAVFAAILNVEWVTGAHGAHAF